MFQSYRISQTPNGFKHPVQLLAPGCGTADCEQQDVDENRQTGDNQRQIYRESGAGWNDSSIREI